MPPPRGRAQGPGRGRRTACDEQALPHQLPVVKREIEVLIVAVATTGTIEANNIRIKQIKRIARGYRNAVNHKSVILMTSPDGGMTLNRESFFLRTVKSRLRTRNEQKRPTPDV
jgi:hypothetical protein